MTVWLGDGYGFALIREGTTLQEHLTTRPLAGVDWTVDTVVIYHRIRHPKTVPLVVKQLKRRQQAEAGSVVTTQRTVSEPASAGLKRPSESVRPGAEQQPLLWEAEFNKSDCA